MVPTTGQEVLQEGSRVISKLTARDYNAEYKDNTRKYAYDFDYMLRDYMMQTFQPFLTKGKALEMGCYKGEFTKTICKHFTDVTVIEGADELIDYTKQQVGDHVKFIHSTFESVELEATYDSIFLLHTLEHLDDPVLVLKRVNNWLSESGRFFLVVPNANAPSRQIAVKMGLVPYNSAVIESERLHGHRKTYSLDTLEHDALSGGLKVIHRGGIFFKPLASSQFDEALAANVITRDYLEGCYKLGMIYPDLCASIFLVCEKGD
ncbi:MAG: class I SAM-dependent methyltransferase [Acidobacteria bacterium]|nr:MAG: class I SAM-dependent methyltransferase [Acidobacteriota bacterium]